MHDKAEEKKDERRDNGHDRGSYEKIPGALLILVFVTARGTIGKQAHHLRQPDSLWDRE